MLDKILCCFFLAGLAETNQLKQVTIYSEPGLSGQVLLHLPQLKPREINNRATVGANQVVVMPCGTNRVAAAAISGVQLADKP